MRLLLFITASLVFTMFAWYVAAEVELDPKFEAALAQHFGYGPPMPEPTEVADPALGQELDARYLTAFPDFDRSYAPSTRAQARAVLNRLARDAKQLSHEQFVLRVAEAAALADNGHTAIDRNAFMKNTPRIPVRTYLFADGLHVLYASAAYEHLLGARIDTIEGRRVGELFQALRKYRGGEEHFRKLQLIPVLESPALLHAAGLSSSRERLKIQGVTASGQPFAEAVQAERRERSAWVSSTSRLLFPGTLGNVKMKSFLSAKSVDLPFFHAAEHLFWSEKLGQGLYVHLAHSADADEEPIAAFLGRCMAEIKSTRPAFVILDMRLNGGGDYTTTYEFAKKLPSEVSGAPIYVLTSGWTFSAAITTVAALKTAGGSQVKIVGEPVGDRLDFWAEGQAFSLPNAFIRVSYSTGRHIYNGPCLDRETCFWLNEHFPVRVKSLAPDISAPWTFAAYRQGRDPALEAARADAEKRAAAN